MKHIMTPTELKQDFLKLAAKLLPERVYIDGGGVACWCEGSLRVKDTELLHICHLIEQGMNLTEYQQFEELIGELTIDSHKRSDLQYRFVSANWPQRAEAILKVYQDERK